ncbi:hypothetical protein [Actinoplanes aureus]|uniref:Uncharacterized protein n=1 Tax=Actinoplanes aureus TaxID=2792083 RepID=A0A931CIB5_9ACTN|nr:hypothetical protein [Actinoplanes aureus]MBG0568177.1 hypothetical protein [Actinoplanes aureus]
MRGARHEEDNIDDQNHEVRLTNLEAHAFRTNCRLRALESLAAALTGADQATDAAQPATVDQRLDRIEQALEKLRRRKTILPKQEYDKAKNAAGADGLSVAE